MGLVSPCLFLFRLTCCSGASLVNLRFLKSYVGLTMLTDELMTKLLTVYFKNYIGQTSTYMDL